MNNIFNIQNNTSRSNNNSKSKGISNTQSNNSSNETITSTRINTYLDGLVIGSNKGNILFVEKIVNSDYNFSPVR